MLARRGEHKGRVTAEERLVPHCALHKSREGELLPQRFLVGSSEEGSSALRCQRSGQNGTCTELPLPAALPEEHTVACRLPSAFCPLPTRGEQNL